MATPLVLFGRMFERSQEPDQGTDGDQSRSISRIGLVMGSSFAFFSAS